MRRVAVLALVLLMLIAAACSGSVSSELFSGCVAGVTQQCACGSGSTMGIQVCGQTGSFLACICAGGDAGSDSGCGGTAACVGKCGELANSCGTIVDCGGCPTGDACGAGGVPNVCSPGTCTPSCAGQVCGASNGCDGFCEQGSCATGQHCAAGSCTCDTTSCAGCCSGNTCEPGTDGSACGAGGSACTVCAAGTTCGTTCGTCGGNGQPCCDGTTCSSPLSCGGAGVTGECGCTPTCEGQVCGGGDGCGGVCTGVDASCDVGQFCNGGVCACGPTSCSGCCTGSTCEDGTDPSACGQGGITCAVCAATCGDTGACDCVPSCTGACGADDGCGGTCATGSCATGQSCNDGVCECGPASCAGCCEGATCELGNAAVACGSGGNSCIQCTAATGGPTCSGGVCTGTTGCQSPEVTCGAGCCNVYGNSAPLGGTGNYTSASLCVRPVTIAEAGKLVDIGILGTAAGTDVVMGLYTNNAGVPGTLVAQTGVGALTNGPTVLPTPLTAVAAGSYFIAAEFTGNATVVESPTATATSYCSTQAFAATMPATFPAVASYVGRLADWYLLVE